MVDGDHKVSRISSEAIFTTRPISSLKFLLGVILCLCLIIFDINFNYSFKFRGYALDSLAPIYNLTQIPIKASTSIYKRISNRNELREDLIQLKNENYKLRLITTQLKEISKINQQLGLIWNSDQVDKESYVLVQKRFFSNDSLRPRLILSLGGKASSIKVDQPVLSLQGVMGKIISSGLTSAEVMTVYDPRSMIPVISSVTRIHGILQGRGLSNRGKLLNIKKTSPLKEGESLYSSGLGQVFPPNFLVGKIISIEDKPDNEFLDVKVQFLEIPEKQDFFLIFTGS